MREKEILLFARPFMELENLMLGERSQRKTNTLISLICGI